MSAGILGLSAAPLGGAGAGAQKTAGAVGSQLAGSSAA